MIMFFIGYNNPYKYIQITWDQYCEFLVYLKPLQISNQGPIPETKFSA